MSDLNVTSAQHANLVVLIDRGDFDVKTGRGSLEWALGRAAWRRRKILINLIPQRMVDPSERSASTEHKHPLNKEGT
jgi:hypothetical protein